MRAMLRGLLLVVSRLLLRIALLVSTPGIFSQALAEILRRDRRFLSSGLDALDAQLKGAARDMEMPLAYRQEGYGQEGEDLVLMRLFAGRDNGFYVDIGAHHPARFSNTFLLYRKGWRGLNIDAMPGSMTPFRRLRPDDINLELMVSADDTPRTFFIFDEPALNTASDDILKMREAEVSGHHVVQRMVMVPRPLSAILVDHVPEGKQIDLLNVDVEGLDLSVLASNDWEKFRPEIIVAEILETDLSSAQQSALGTFLAERGYQMIAKLYNSAIFRRLD